jgi:endonuclease/exonuclease/phosphatase family metal-dependent hydrolase
MTTDTLREDKGNAVLSTLPLRRLVAIELPFEAGRKVAVGATVFLTPTDSLQLVSVHLDVASTLARAVSTGNSWRLRQGLGFVEGLQLADSVGSTIATLAAGDFNTWSGDETVIRHMYDYFPESPPQGSRRTRGSFPTDYLFFRQAGTTVVLLDGPEILEERYHSDHLPLVATVGAAGLPSPGP